jgi:predicted rRNA methylase YqxC with S4 and FtsJ domains
MHQFKRNMSGWSFLIFLNFENITGKGIKTQINILFMDDSFRKLNDLFKYVKIKRNKIDTFWLPYFF